MPQIGADSIRALVAVEVDLWNLDTSAIVTLRLCNRGPLSRTVDAGRVLFLPRLITPFKLGSRVEIGEYGSSPRGSNNGGIVEFAMDEEILTYMDSDHVWHGREIRIYAGPLPYFDDAYPEIWDTLTLAYIGMVSNLNHNTQTAKISVTDKSFILNEPVIDLLYNEVDDPTVESALIGKPKPRLWGEANFIEPTLEDAVNYVYRISKTTLSPAILNLSITLGGIFWTGVASSPTPGEFSADLVNGTFTLGGTPDNGELRVYARTPDYNTFNYDDLITDLVVGAGGSVDATSMTALSVTGQGGFAPRVGYYLGSQEVNLQDVLDDIMAGIFGWWCATPLGDIAAGVIRAPYDVESVATLTEAEIDSIELTNIMPPAYRVRVEYGRHWFPASQWFSAIDEDEQADQASTGTIAEEWNAEDLVPAFRTIYPKAIDLPVIHSLFLFASDAEWLRDQVALAIGVERKVYTIEAWLESDLDLYDTIEIDHPFCSGFFRVMSIIRPYGGGSTTLVLWG